MLRMMAASIALLTLGGCAVKIDETNVFHPVPFDAALAERRGERMTGERAFASEAEWTAAWDLRATRHGSLPPAVAPFIPAKVEHGRFDTPGGGIAWTTISRDASSDTLIVRCGGNASTRQHSGYHYAVSALPHGDVLLFDYPGYGETGGEASAERFEAMRAELVDLVRAKANGRRLVLWGHSLGGLVCSELARTMPEVDGVIIETSARNAEETARSWTPWYAAPFVRIVIARGLRGYDSVAALKDFRGPVLVMGGETDETLPVQLSRSIGKGLKEQGADVAYVEFAGRGHSDLILHADFAPTLNAFFQRLKAAS